MNSPHRLALLLLLAAPAAFAAQEKPAPATAPAATPAAAAPAAEVTPLTRPGAETFVYRDDPAEPMRLHVFKPRGWAAGDARPALLFFFGGGWTRGTPANAAGWGKFAADLGLVGIAPDYRTKGRHGTSPLASVADGRAALHWVQAHARELGVDPARIAVGGNSAGGHVALWTGIAATPPGATAAEAPLQPPAALILFSAVSDTSPETGYTPGRFGADATALSPLHQLGPRMPPVLMFHGDVDKTVPFREAQALHAKLTAAGQASELVVVPGGDHNFSTQLPEWRDKSRALVKAFLAKQHLLPAAP